MAVSATLEYRSLAGSQREMVQGYLVTEATTAQNAIAAVRLEAPEAIGSADPIGNTLQLVNVQVTEVDIKDEGSAVNTYRCEAIYEYRYTCPKLSYDFTGETLKVTQSLETQQAYLSTGAVGEEPKDFNRAIDVTSTGDVLGTDAIRPAGEMVLIWHPKIEFTTGVPHVWNPAYWQKVNSMVGTINEEPFYGWAKNEVLLTGIVSEYLEYENRWEVEMRFRVGQIRSFSQDELLPGFPSMVIDPHSVVWFDRLKADKTRANPGPYRAPEVIQVNVERIYEEADFTQLFKDALGNDGIAACPTL